MKKIFLLLIAFVLTACNPSVNNINNDLNETTQTTPIKNLKLNDIEVFFSQTKGSYKGGIDEKIVSDINSSKEYVYMALYEFTNRKIKDALVEAYSRGVEVKVITDDKSYSKEYNLFDELEDAGIEVKTDESFSRGLMHSKFLLIDDKVVWSGSGNYTYHSFYRNYENYVRVTNKEVVANYTKEFKELESGKLEKGGFKSSSYELYFSPEDNFRKSRLISLIKSAKKSIYIMAFALNDEELKDAIIDDRDRGVDIHIIFDKEQTVGYQKDYTQYYNLKDAGIDTVLVGDSNHKMHNKVIVVDKETVVTGSYNFTVSANYDNCENALIIKNRYVAKKYLDKFQNVYEEISQ